jgi:hypothetical protein
MAIPGPLLPSIEAVVPPEVASFVTSLVANRLLLVAALLGPLIASGSHFLELLVVIQD